jgi:hypothetical protein
VPPECVLYSTIGVHAQGNVWIKLSTPSIDIQSVFGSSRITIYAAHKHLVKTGDHTITEMFLYVCDSEMVLLFSIERSVGFSGTQRT